MFGLELGCGLSGDAEQFQKKSKFISLDDKVQVCIGVL